MSDIPEDVIEASAKAAFDGAFMHHAPEDAPRWDDEPESQESWREVARAAAAPVAEWARKQTLEEVMQRALSVWSREEVIGILYGMGATGTPTGDN